MIKVTQEFNGVKSSTEIDNPEIERDKKQVLDIIEKAITVVEVKELKTETKTNYSLENLKLEKEGN